MEKVDEKIKKAKIYKLYCSDGYYYIGSTITKYLSQRLCKHKADSMRSQYKTNKLYTHINLIGWDNVKIILIDEIEYTSREHLRKEENKYIVEKLTDTYCLNHNRAYITDDERIQHIKEYNSQKQFIRNKLITCECGIEHTFGRTNQHINTIKHKKRMNDITIYTNRENERASPSEEARLHAEEQV